MKKYIHLSVMVCGIVILVSCLSPYNGEDESKSGLPGTETPFSVTNDLFNPDSSDPNIIRFFTNDPKYRTPYGYTLWSYGGSSPATFVDRTVRVYKTMGSLIAGYGIIICSSQQLVNNRLETVFLTVMINNSGQYAIGKVIGGSYTHIRGWTSNNYLVKGIVNNKIRVKKKDGPNDENTYELFFNDAKKGEDFTDAEEPHCKEYGQNGYIVVISPDDLNKSSVEVWFVEEP